MSNEIFEILNAQKKLNRITQNLRNFLLLFERFRIENQDVNPPDETILIVTDIEKSLLEILANEQTYEKHLLILESDEDE